ncbi:MAG TPA: quinone-dependent dihydroorotate dehydrogenase [Ktedonobacterales bacterium]|jgi:dihydroorotate dehydrogenase|nr:quinone-dependent dihydroorotate dehydrogenase [Ktedonobacterales bacterium]
MLYRRIARPLLFGVGQNVEAIHERVLGGLATASRSPTLTHAIARASEFAAGGPTSPSLAREVFGLRFPNPIGLAAGFDKNAVAVPALAALGFGFVEVGTVTRLPQPGNPRPRLFRLPSDEALINRMGFNNQGAAAVASRLAAMPRVAVPVGISLGKSKVTPLDQAVEDYLGSLDLLYLWGDYFAVNVSSPNTPGLRDLQERDRLDALLATLIARLSERAIASGRATPKPLLVKVAPDLDDAALDDLVDVCLGRGASGLIAVNTTISRDALSAWVPRDLREQSGGLSGRPLHARAVEVVRRLHQRAGDRLPIIGSGGVFCADDARRLFDAGASLIQLYTSFIYEGPSIAHDLCRDLATKSQLTAP